MIKALLCDMDGTLVESNWLRWCGRGFDSRSRLIGSYQV